MAKSKKGSSKPKVVGVGDGDKAQGRTGARGQTGGKKAGAKWNEGIRSSAKQHSDMRGCVDKLKSGKDVIGPVDCPEVSY